MGREGERTADCGVPDSASLGYMAQVETKAPIGLVVLVTIAVGVVALLLIQAAIGFVLGILRLGLILAAFGAIAYIGMFLWRRGEAKGS